MRPDRVHRAGMQELRLVDEQARHIPADAGGVLESDAHQRGSVESLSVLEGSFEVEVAGELQVNPGTLGNWVKRYRQDNPEPVQELKPADHARLAELEDEVRRLRMENEFLKKAAAFFAREQD